MENQTLGGLVQDVTPRQVSIDVDPETYNHVGLIDVEVILKKDRANA
jgi:hypothetical protein